MTKILFLYHQLLIEQGREYSIGRSERKYKSCNKDNIEDECLFTLICSLYAELRSLYITKYY